MPGVNSLAPMYKGRREPPTSWPFDLGPRRTGRLTDAIQISARNKGAEGREGTVATPAGWCSCHGNQDSQPGAPAPLRPVPRRPGQLCFFRESAKGCTRAGRGRPSPCPSASLPFETLRGCTGHVDWGLRGPSSRLPGGTTGPSSDGETGGKVGVGCCPAPCRLGGRTVGAAAQTQTRTS